MKLAPPLVLAGLLTTTLLAHAGGTVVETGCRTNPHTGLTHCNSAPVVRSATPLAGGGKLITRAPMAPALNGQGCFVGAHGRTYTLMPNGRKRFGPC